MREVEELLLGVLDEVRILLVQEESQVSCSFAIGNFFKKEFSKKLHILLFV